MIDLIPLIAVNGERLAVIGEQIARLLASLDEMRDRSEMGNDLAADLFALTRRSLHAAREREAELLAECDELQGRLAALRSEN